MSENLFCKFLELNGPNVRNVYDVVVVVVSANFFSFLANVSNI